MKIEYLDFNKLFLERSFEWLTDPEINRLLDVGRVSKEEQQIWFKGLKTRKNYLIWGVSCDGMPIGAVGLKNINFSEKEAEYFGYIGEKEYWGRGIGTKMLEFAKTQATDIGIEKLYLNVIPENQRAIHLYKKFGFESRGGYGDTRYNAVILSLERNIKLIVLGTGDVTVKFIKQCKTVKNLTILGNIPDRSLEYEERLIFDQQVRNLSIDILLFNDTVFSRADIIFSIEYRRIIPDYLVQKYNFVNCHGGLLPQWRGFSCNAWAIMNGAVEIGYSIHKMNEQLDDGILYFVKRIPIAKNQTYADVHGMLIDSILTEVPEVIKQIASGELSGVEQEGEYAYCNRFFPEMGFLKDFDKPSIDIVNLYRCMARPLGSGVYFRFKNRRFTIGKVSDARDFGLMDYIGIPGKVINVTSDSLWIKTKDSGVVLSDIQDEEGIEVMPKDCFRNGNLIQNGK